MTPHSIIHAGAARLGLDDDTRRALYERLTGKRSLTVMTAAELDAVAAEIVRLGGRPKARVVHVGPQAKKAKALWIAAWNLGVVAARSERALGVFVKRQCGLDSLAWLRSAEDGKRVVEALKAMLARPVEKGGGGVDWTPRASLVDASRGNDRWAVVEAQWALLAARGCGYSGLGETFGRQQLHGAARSLTGKGSEETFTPGDWQAVMNWLGVYVRGVGGRRSRSHRRAAR